MRKKQSLKTPNDYPLLGYRVLPAVKDSITLQLNEVLDIYNNELDENQKPYKKNDIFVKALLRGLNDLKRAKN